MGFSSDINKFIKKVEGRTEDIVNKIVLELYKSVVEKSPVDTGRFRNSWFITGNPDDINEVQNSLIAAIPGSLTKMGDAVYIVNKLPYAMKLEFGSSKQAPLGIARITVMEFQRHLDKAIASAKANRP